MKTLMGRDSETTTGGHYLLPKVVAIILLFGGVVWSEVLSSPAEPKVPPIIPTVYSNDLNGNAIDDKLESKASQHYLG
jgi:hypothetical protein